MRPIDEAPHSSLSRSNRPVPAPEPFDESREGRLVLRQAAGPGFHCPTWKADGTAGMVRRSGPTTLAGRCVSAKRRKTHGVGTDRPPERLPPRRSRVGRHRQPPAISGVQDLQTTGGTCICRCPENDLDATPVSTIENGKQTTPSPNSPVTPAPNVDQNRLNPTAESPRKFAATIRSKSVLGIAPRLILGGRNAAPKSTGQTSRGKCGQL